MTQAFLNAFDARMDDITRLQEVAQAQGKPLTALISRANALDYVFEVERVAKDMLLLHELEPVRKRGEELWDEIDAMFGGCDDA
jgi:hypothetical protein